MKKGLVAVLISCVFMGGVSYGDQRKTVEENIERRESPRIILGVKDVTGKEKEGLLRRLDRSLDSQNVDLTRVQLQRGGKVTTYLSIIRKSDGEKESKLFKISTNGAIHPVKPTLYTDGAYKWNGKNWVKKSPDTITELAVRATIEYLKNKREKPFKGISAVLPIYDKGTKDAGIFVLVFYGENEEKTGQITFTPFAQTSISFNLVDNTLGSSFKEVAPTSLYWQDVEKMLPKDEMDKVGDIFLAAEKEKEVEEYYQELGAGINEREFSA